MNRAREERAAARAQALARYRLSVTRKALDGLVRKIQAGEGRFVERRSVRCSIWDVDHEGTVVRVAYDRNQKTIAGFLRRKG